MPELPEVEVVRKSLEPFVKEKKIRDIKVYHEGIFHGLYTEEVFCKAVLGKKIKFLKRRGKYILIFLDSGQILLVHLRMTGKLLFRQESTIRGKHDHLVLILDKGELIYNDVRRFGGFMIFENEVEVTSYLDKRLGVEPFSKAFTGDFLYRETRNKKKSIKALLLSQEVVAGLGNIYVDEVLFRSGIRPGKSSYRLTKKECSRLSENIKKVLQKAIDFGGSSINDYMNALGEVGHYQEEHLVYGRAGKPCKKCGTPLKKIEIGNRTTVYCPVCQKS